MPNIGALLKDEIARLSRKEIRKQASPLKKAAASHRHQIAALKRQIDQLQRQVASVGRQTVAGSSAGAPASDDGITLRFQARGLRTLRSRLGLSAGDLGKLIGVTAQSVYNWETKKASPRKAQIAAIAALRGLGKREAEERLAGAVAPSKGKRKAAKVRKAGKAAGAAKASKPGRARKSKAGRPAKAATTKLGSKPDSGRQKARKKARK